MEQLADVHRPHADRRRRAEHLRERQPFAAEVLTLELALLDVQEAAFAAALERPPEPAAAPRWVAREILPRVIEATVAAGPARLVEQVVARFHSADLEDVVTRWLRGKEQALVDRYLARAASEPLLEALPADVLSVLCDGPRDARHCPRCGGPPQLSYFALSGEALVTGPRYLVCARCLHGWVYTRMVCAGCGEATSGQLPVYSESSPPSLAGGGGATLPHSLGEVAEGRREAPSEGERAQPRLPHLRIDACETCRGYLLGVDLRRDAAAVPVVDELAALPLDLYAKERGLSKVTPNLMGF